MKKIICLMLTFACVISLMGCGQSDEPQAPNAKVPAIMYNDTTYRVMGDKVSATIDESEYLGTIETVVNISEWPQENGQTNHNPYLGTRYALYEDEIVLLVDNEWVKCKTE